MTAGIARRCCRSLIALHCHIEAVDGLKMSNVHSRRGLAWIWTGKNTRSDGWTVAPFLLNFCR